MKVVSLPTLDELRDYVRQTLCEHDNLDLEDSPFFEGKITRHGEMCGLFFQVQGPRLLKVYALWAAEENRILFYDGLGNRFLESACKRCAGHGQVGGVAASPAT